MTLDRPLLAAAIIHAIIALVCGALLLVDAAPILGVHPALKPLKFAISIALFLASMAALIPALATSVRFSLSTALVSALSAEMFVIALQALRGRRSHFNTETALDSAVVIVMFAGIAVLVIAMLAITFVAMTRPLIALPPVIAWAWRAALCMFVLAIYSGLAMGGRTAHTVGGPDGGPGMPLTNWSTHHGDLRISHFVALHALQVLPLGGWLIQRVAPERLRAIALVTLVALVAGITLWTLARALSGRPAYDV